MISKELLSEALGLNIESIKGIQKNKNSITIWKGKQNTYPYALHSGSDINIHELAHKCKEWALTEDYVVVSRSRYKLEGYDCDIYTKDDHCIDDFESDTEPEAIFKACQWILENKID